MLVVEDIKSMLSSYFKKSEKEDKTKSKVSKWKDKKIRTQINGREK